MSEEILKALMQLFAIISKQDGLVSEFQRARVETFLKQQISPNQVAEYLAFFDKESGYDEQKKITDLDEKPRLTSVNDSVKTLGICRKINKTLEQKQKIVVFVRILEMIWADKNISPLAMELIETVAERVAQLLLSEFATSKVEVTVSKPGAVKQAQTVGVHIVRSRS